MFNQKVFSIYKVAKYFDLVLKEKKLKLNKKIRREIIEALERDVTNFNNKTKRIDSQPIRLSYVVIGC